MKRISEPTSVLAAFRIPPIKELQQTTTYAKPAEVTRFSYSPKRELLFDQSALQYYKPKKLPIDLNTGFPQRYIQRDTDIEPLDSLLLAVKNQKSTVNVQFCTWRGIITKIICTPYSKNDGWELIATKSNGTIYMMEHTEERKAKKVNYENADLFTYYGYKFESECTGGLEVAENDDVEVVVNTNVQFCSVFTSKIGDFGVLLGAEVDCLFQKPASDSIHDIQAEYTELKTHKVMTHPRQKTSFVKFKLLKTWAQSFLVGVKRVVFGFRTEEGFIEEIKTFTTEEFPRMARKERLWDPNVCLTMGSKVLAFLQKHITVDDMNTTYIVRYSPGSQSVEIESPTNDDVFIKQKLFL
jgi:RAT1-interacting protein